MSEGLDKLRKPFIEGQIGKLPKPTRAQTDEVKANFRAGARCNLCGAWHHPAVVHLDYVGHAAVTDRLLDADPGWTWEPLAYDDSGLPLFDASGGLWAKLTVCGVTRIGYGNADKKPTADAGAREKEVIGDFLRNSAMRFGVALDLWHKGDLHASDDSPPRAPTPPPNSVPLEIPPPLAAQTAPSPDPLASVRQPAPPAAPAQPATPTPPKLMPIFSADGSVHAQHAIMGDWLSSFEVLAKGAGPTVGDVLLKSNAAALEKIAARGIYDERITRIMAAIDAAPIATTEAPVDDF